MTTLDKDGQPSIGLNHWRNLKKSIDTLLGICSGLIADNRLNESEALFLDIWLRENQDVARCWPGEVVAQRVSAILDDGVVTDTELADLKDTLEQLLGGSLSDDGTASGMATRLPINKNAEIQINGRAFCLTGKFVFGPRSTCARAITDRNGVIKESVSEALDYLVIGTLSSRDWMHTSHGLKIEKAVSYQQKKGFPLIIAEEDWKTALANQPIPQS